MKKVILCSLCHNGILGGALYFEPQSIRYRTNKLTVDKKYRNLELPINEINKIAWKTIVFPIVTFHMTNKEEYKFLIFNKNTFERYYQEYQIKE